MLENPLTKVSRKALIAALLIGFSSLLAIWGIGFARVAAKPASKAGWIVFRKRDSGIWIMDADGEEKRHLITNGSSPAWSPDGQRITFVYSPDGNPDSTGIFIINADGSNVKRLTNDEYDSAPAWSPDGEQIAFSRAVREDKDGWLETKTQSIYVIDVDGRNLRMLTAKNLLHRDSYPNWSPDGTRIAFTRFNRDGARAEDQIWVMDADGDNQKMLKSGGHYFEPVWSPDGAKIVFASGSIGRFNICVMDADGQNAEKLTDGQCYDMDPKWSPDGKEIIFSSDRDGNEEIYIMDADGSDARRITRTSTADECIPDWTAFSYAVEPAGKLKTKWGKIRREVLSR